MNDLEIIKYLLNRLDSEIKEHEKTKKHRSSLASAFSEYKNKAEANMFNLKEINKAYKEGIESGALVWKEGK